MCDNNRPILDQIDRLFHQQFELLLGLLDGETILLYGRNCKRIRELVDQLGPAVNVARAEVMSGYRRSCTEGLG